MGRHLQKLVNMHTLNLASTRCDVFAPVAVVGVDLLWDVCLCDQTTGSVLKELSPWVHIWGSW